MKQSINLLRSQKPVILNLTNLVTMDFIANSLLAIGAAPIMSCYEDEICELVSISSAVYINIGTLNSDFIKLVNIAVESAKNLKKPIILDPVGSGATKERTVVAREIAKYASIIRGNASEIISLVDIIDSSKGVESKHVTTDAKPIAYKVAKTYNSVVIISGEIDFITNGNIDCEMSYGSDLMPLVTGMGCTLTAVIASFRSVINDSFIASKLAVKYFTLCGSIASLSNKHPASFKVSFVDELHAGNFALMEKIHNENK
jgi:hydroxyethylthiazole kinase